MIVKHCDCRTLGYCNKGLRFFFNKNNMDWSDFVKNGIDDSKLIPFNNTMINRAIEQAKKRMNDGEQ